MSKPFYDQIAIIGTGMMGTSLALAIKRNGLCGKIIGIDRNFENLKAAKRLSAIDSYTDCLKDGIADAVMIIFAIPIMATMEVAKRIVYAVRKDALITDIGSTKGEVVQKMTELFYGHSNYVGSHPITGTEKSGAINAIDGLYDGKKCIITPTEKTERFAVDAITKFWESAGSEVIVMDPHEHDRIMAMVSHLPHVVAYALAGSVLDQQKMGNMLFPYAGGGLKDFTRIAGSDPVMWRDIFISNAHEILNAIDQFSKVMERLRRMIKERDTKGIHTLLEDIKEVRRHIADR